LQPFSKWCQATISGKAKSHRAGATAVAATLASQQLQQHCGKQQSAGVMMAVKTALVLAMATCWQVVPATITDKAKSHKAGVTAVNAC